MTCRQYIRPFNLVQVNLIFSNMSARHATTCTGLEGFFIITSEGFRLQGEREILRSELQLVFFIIGHMVQDFKSYLVWSRFDSDSVLKAYQISHRRGVLLHGTPFFMSCLPGFYFIVIYDENNELEINRYYKVVMSRAMSITRQPAPNAYRKRL